MANALQTLFSDIANAIRSKTGNADKMAPADFPTIISSLEVVAPYWEVSDSGCLYIYDVRDYEDGEQPWYAMKDTITSIEIADGVPRIGKNSFREIPNLISVSIPDSVTNIGNNAFYGSGLQSVFIPDSVTSVGMRAFYDCDSLVSVRLPKNGATYGDYAFSMTDNLANIEIGSATEIIAERTFYYCQG
jgi:hypothetical protein